MGLAADVSLAVALSLVAVLLLAAVLSSAAVVSLRIFCCGLLSFDELLFLDWLKLDGAAAMACPM